MALRRMFVLWRNDAKVRDDLWRNPAGADFSVAMELVFATKFRWTRPQQDGIVAK
jgi:hypothetical protein